VEQCSRPSTDSPLSSLPGTPSQLQYSPAIEPVEDLKTEINQKDTIITQLDTATISPFPVSAQPPPLEPIRPYSDPENEFEYYNQPEAVEAPEPGDEDPDRSDVPENGDSKPASPPISDATDSIPSSLKIQQVVERMSSTPKPEIFKNSKNAKKIVLRFPKFTPVENFHEQLKNAEDMSYNELYAVSAKVSDVLAAYQSEWDEIEKEINQYEAYQKAELKRAEDSAKEVAELAKARDDEARGKVQMQFQKELKLKGQDWANWLASYERENPGSNTLMHLQNLKNPQFMAIANKKKRGVKNKEDFYENVPPPDAKITKEEANFERRKRGRLLDPIKFDDMKLADVYGFDYSSHPKHYANQPIEERSQKRKLAQLAAEDAGSPGVQADSTENGRTRQRRTAKRFYETEKSGSPESEEDGLPAKRARRTKIFEDGTDANGRSRTQSRSGTPAPTKTFPSGKRIGRPPKSRLQAVHMPSVTPDPAHGSQFTARQEYSNASQELDPSQEHQLQNAAESLVNQAAANQALVTPVKKKHPGGRPRKIVAPSSGNVEPTSQPKKNKGGRPRKYPLPVDVSQNIKIEPALQSGGVQMGDENHVMQSTEQGDGSHEQELTSSGRPKRKRTTVETDENPMSLGSLLRQSEEDSPTTKKRRMAKQSTEDPDFEYNGQPKSKRKRDATFSEPRAIAPLENEIPIKKRRSKGSLPKPGGAASVAREGEILVHPDGRPKTEDELKNERILKMKAEKSRKLSESMRRRWAAGEMEGAKQTRAKNNELKKAAKEKEAAEASNMPINYNAKPPPILIPAPQPHLVSVPQNPFHQPASAASVPILAPKPPPKKPGRKPKNPAAIAAAAAAAAAAASATPISTPTPAQVIPRRKKSSRERKPSKRMGLDGADDEDDYDDSDSDDAAEQHAMSLYDQYRKPDTFAPS
jgi:hypothetical protein